MIRTQRLRMAVLACLSLTACGGTGGLSQSQQDAIESVTELTKWFGAVAGSFSEITKIQELLPGLAFRSFGDCPKISARQDGLGLGIAFDYAGCSGLPFVPGGGPASGTVDLAANLLRMEGTVGFNRFQLAGKDVDGSIGLKPQGGNFTDLRLQIRSLAIQDIGTIEGDTGLLFSTNGSFGMKDGTLAMRDIGGSAFDVRVADLAVNPLRYGNPLPHRGAVSFLVPVNMLGMSNLELKVNFLESTPQDGAVDVLIGPLGPMRYSLKHFGM